MKKFIEKLISRLEEYEYSHLIEHDSEECLHCQVNDDDGCGFRNCFVCVWDKAKEIVNQLAEEYNNGWIPVSSGKLPDDGVPVDVTVREDTDNGGYDLYVFESWYQEGRWAIKKNRYNPTVIAWKPKDTPYQPKGE